MEYMLIGAIIALTVIVSALTVKLWHYRCAIIKLQEDMTLVLNDLTRPTQPRTITCDVCERKFDLSEYAHHVCRRLHAHAV